tara:strand:- start:3098 stop:3439 length:342 start_codon:yes stop_codon:yes gene_type:complete
MGKKYKGELLKGSSHAEGGIPVKVANSRQVEMEGGEGVVNKRAMASKVKYEFNGEEYTTCQIISTLNQSEGDGVKFECDDVHGRKYLLKRGGQISKKTRIKIFLPYSIGSIIE